MNQPISTNCKSRLQSVRPHKARWIRENTAVLGVGFPDLAGDIGQWHGQFMTGAPVSRQEREGGNTRELPKHTDGLWWADHETSKNNLETYWHIDLNSGESTNKLAYAGIPNHSSSLNSLHRIRRTIGSLWQWSLCLCDLLAMVGCWLVRGATRSLEASARFNRFAPSALWSLSGATEPQQRSSRHAPSSWNA